MSLSSSATLNIYADESKNDDFYFLSLVYTSPSHQGFWAQEVRESLEKHGLEEMHGQDIRCDGAAQRCAFSILTKLQMAWKRTKHQEHPIGFCVMGIKRDGMKEKQFFGSENRESNMHRRFLRPAISYALKKIYDMSEDNKLSLFHFYHDESSNLEQNELLVSDWMIKEIMKDCGYCLDSFTNNIEFISSSAKKSGTDASYLIQIADMIAWFVQRGTRRTPPKPNQDYNQQRVFHLWQSEFLPFLLVNRAALYHDETVEPDLKSKMFLRSKTCHLSLFPDANGLVYRPALSDFRY